MISPVRKLAEGDKKVRSFQEVDALRPIFGSNDARASGIFCLVAVKPARAAPVTGSFALASRYAWDKSAAKDL